ncbi:uncharacterized protein VTP21DRAFT_4528 [Calcarisporiella thermophila]|uniref:uncharacterized protein n=1 Tax=Calcarisporiella thermophila TaxID=911321 RepID=UPI003743B774
MYRWTGFGEKGQEMMLMQINGPIRTNHKTEAIEELAPSLKRSEHADLTVKYPLRHRAEIGLRVGRSRMVPNSGKAYDYSIMCRGPSGYLILSR